MSVFEGTRGYLAAHSPFFFSRTELSSDGADFARADNPLPACHACLLGQGAHQALD